VKLEDMSIEQLRDLAKRQEVELSASRQKAETLEAELRISHAACDAQGDLTQKYQALALEAAQAAPQQHAQAAQVGTIGHAHTPSPEIADACAGVAFAAHKLADSRVTGNAQAALNGDGNG